MSTNKSGKSTITIELDVKRLLAALDPEDRAILDAVRRRRKYGWSRAIKSWVAAAISSLHEKAETPKKAKVRKAAKGSGRR